MVTDMTAVQEAEDIVRSQRLRVQGGGRPGRKVGRRPQWIGPIVEPSGFLDRRSPVSICSRRQDNVEPTVIRSSRASSARASPVQGVAASVEMVGKPPEAGTAQLKPGSA